MLNIIHVWDQPGVACVLPKYQRLQGTKSEDVITSNADKFGIYDFYSRNGIVDVVDGPQDFVQECLKRAERADVVHVHSRAELVPVLRKEFGNRITIVLHYHGTDIRGLKKKYSLPHRSVASDLAVATIYAVRRIKNRRSNPQAQKMADMVVVATPDLVKLAPQDSVYVPNPVDADHFRPAAAYKSAGQNNDGMALTFNTETADLQLVVRHFEKSGLPYELEVYDRTKDPIKYGDMPAFLGQYEAYADIRYVNGKVLENLSKTALEALACGLKVIDYQGNVRGSLPPEHEPAGVASRFVGMYQGLLEDNRGTRRLSL
jgi:glycosyltransferase involved in cell wall biosynthesis